MLLNLGTFYLLKYGWLCHSTVQDFIEDFYYIPERKEFEMKYIWMLNSKRIEFSITWEMHTRSCICYQLQRSIVFAINLWQQICSESLACVYNHKTCFTLPKNLELLYVHKRSTQEKFSTHQNCGKLRQKLKNCDIFSIKSFRFNISAY